MKPFSAATDMNAAGKATLLLTEPQVAALTELLRYYQGLAIQYILSESLAHNVQ